MDATKEHLIEKLLKEGKISKDDANVLRKQEEKQIGYIPAQQPQPFKREILKFPQYQPSYPTDALQGWINGELDRRARITRECSCNPANGGSGVCGCINGLNVTY